MLQQVEGGASSGLVSADTLRRELFQDDFPKVYTHPESKIQYFRITTEYPSIDEKPSNSKGFQYFLEDNQKRFAIIIANGMLSLYVLPEFSQGNPEKESDLFRDIQTLLARQIANGLLRGTDAAINSTSTSPTVMAIGLTMGLFNTKGTH